MPPYARRPSTSAPPRRSVTVSNRGRTQPFPLNKRSGPKASLAQVTQLRGILGRFSGFLGRKCSVSQIVSGLCCDSLMGRSTASEQACTSLNLGQQFRKLAPVEFPRKWSRALIGEVLVQCQPDLNGVQGKASSNPAAQGFAQGRVRSGEGQVKEGREFLPVARGRGDERGQEVSWAQGAVARAASVQRRSSERFQGKNGSISSGAFPPAAAQLSKYHVSHTPG